MAFAGRNPVSDRTSRERASAPLAGSAAQRAGRVSASGYRPSSSGTGAAEFHVMRKVIPMPKSIVRGLAAAHVGGLLSLTTSWAAPPMPSATDADYEASGFVVPAGMPALGSGPAIAQAGFQTPRGMTAPGMPSQVRPVSHRGGGIGSRMGPACDGCGDCGGYGCNRCTGGHVGSGILGQLRGGPGGYPGGCGQCGGGCGDFDFSRICLFCQGNGCSLCQSIGKGYALGTLAQLLPYTEAGLGAQRWYDFSAEAIFLGRSGGVGSEVLSRVNGPAGP